MMPGSKQSSGPTGGRLLKICRIKNSIPGGTRQDGWHLAFRRMLANAQAEDAQADGGEAVAQVVAYARESLLEDARRLLREGRSLKGAAAWVCLEAERMGLPASLRQALDVAEEALRENMAEDRWAGGHPPLSRKEAWAAVGAAVRMVAQAGRDRARVKDLARLKVEEAERPQRQLHAVAEARRLLQEAQWLLAAAGTTGDFGELVGEQLAQATHLEAKIGAPAPHQRPRRRRAS